MTSAIIATKRGTGLPTVEKIQFQRVERSEKAVVSTAEKRDISGLTVKVIKDILIKDILIAVERDHTHEAAHNPEVAQGHDRQEGIIERSRGLGQMRGHLRKATDVTQPLKEQVAKVMIAQRETRRNLRSVGMKGLPQLKVKIQLVPARKTLSSLFLHQEKRKNVQNQVLETTCEKM